MDAAGFVCATDLGFMSTSLAEATPVHYMQKDGPNLLWKLDVGDEDAVGFHCGAVRLALALALAPALALARAAVGFRSASVRLPWRRGTCFSAGP
jgi:hypothetical protein